MTCCAKRIKNTEKRIRRGTIYPQESVDKQKDKPTDKPTDKS